MLLYSKLNYPVFKIVKIGSASTNYNIIMLHVNASVIIQIFHQSFEDLIRL